MHENERWRERFMACVTFASLKRWQIEALIRTRGSQWRIYCSCRRIKWLKCSLRNRYFQSITGSPAQIMFPYIDNTLSVLLVVILSGNCFTRELRFTEPSQSLLHFPSWTFISFSPSRTEVSPEIPHNEWTAGLQISVLYRWASFRLAQKAAEKNDLLSSARGAFSLSRPELSWKLPQQHVNEIKSLLTSSLVLVGLEHQAVLRVKQSPT